MDQNWPNSGWSDPKARIGRSYARNGLHAGGVQQFNGRWLASPGIPGIEAQLFDTMDEAMRWVEECCQLNAELFAKKTA